MRVVMGTRPTPPAATAGSDQSSRVLDIKKESPDDEIKVRRSFFDGIDLGPSQYFLGGVYQECWSAFRVSRPWDAAHEKALLTA